MNIKRKKGIRLGLIAPNRFKDYDKFIDQICNICIFDNIVIKEFVIINSSINMKQLIDRLINNHLRNLNINVVQIEIDVKKYNRNAGHVGLQKCLDYSDKVIIFYDSNISFFKEIIDLAKSTDKLLKDIDIDK